MASYVVNYHTATTQVLSPTESVPVQRFTITTTPHGVRLYVNVPTAQYKLGNQDDYLEPPASITEGLFSEGLVSDANYVQDADANDLQAGFVDFTVSYVGPDSSGIPSTAIVQVPMTALASRTAYTAWAAAQPGGHPIVTAYNGLVTSTGGPASDKV